MILILRHPSIAGFEELPTRIMIVVFKSLDLIERDDEGRFPRIL